MKFYNESNDNLIKIAGIEKESIVDGPGIRYVIFTQGCPHHCEGCHNPQTHDFEGGKYINVNELLEDIEKNPLLKGITLSGGEPFLQAKKLSKFVDKAKEKRNDLDIICYTGFEFENLIKNSNDQNGFKELIDKTDILIDGKFDKNKMAEGLMFRGSSNQRAIDIKNTFEQEKIVEKDFNDEFKFNF